MTIAIPPSLWDATPRAQARWLRGQGVEITDIAHQVSRSPSTVFDWVADIQTTRRARVNVAARKRRVAQMAAIGMSVAEISRALLTHKTTVARWVAEARNG